MARHLVTINCSLALSLLCMAVPTARSEDGKELFQKLCTSCHTLGGGDTVGPDLKGVSSRQPADWLLRIITEPDRLTAEKDPAQTALVKKYGMEMPKLGVSGDDARKIVAFFGEGGGAAPGQPPPPSGPAAAPAPPAPPQVAATPALIARGRDLFTGKTPFAKGGAPCVSCHELRYPGVQGGTLAADLTGIYSGMGESGVRGVLMSLAFPVMKRVYADHPLTEAEMTPLVALFQDAARQNHPARRIFPYSGLAAFALFIVAAIVIRRRIR